MKPTLLAPAVLCLAILTGEPVFAQEGPACEFNRKSTDACLDRFGQSKFGLPRDRGADASEDAGIICRGGYVLSFNCATGNPEWVVERLTPAILTGKASRLDNFKEDPDLTGGPTLSDYAGTRLDRGHQAPAADFKKEQGLTDESFYLTNMSPQVGIGFNRGIWAKLEAQVRSWVLCGPHPELMVITGPIFGDDPRPTKPGAKVLKPIAYFKIAFDTRSRRAVAFRLDNRKAEKGELLSDKVVTIDQIEDETGFNFFSALNARQQRVLESNKGIDWGFDHRCKVADED